MDMILRGGLAGLLGYIACGISNLILYLPGILPSTGIHYNAVFMTPPGTPVTGFTLLIGVIVGLLVTGPFVGVIIANLLSRTGYDYAWLKGYGVATVLWPVHVAIIPNLIAPRLWTTLPPVMVFACYFFEAIFGIVTASTLQLWQKKAPLESIPNGN